MHYLVVTVWHVLGTTVVQVVFALEHHSLAFRAKSATTTRVALSPVTALFRMVELRSVLPMAPYVQDISARYKALNSFFWGRGGGGEYLWHGPRIKGAFCAEKRQNFGWTTQKALHVQPPLTGPPLWLFAGGNG